MSRTGQYKALRLRKRDTHTLKLGRLALCKFSALHYEGIICFRFPDVASHHASVDKSERLATELVNAVT